MQQVGAYTDVEAVGHASFVADLARVAEVVFVALLVLHPLQDPDLTSSVMSMVHWDGGGRAGLLVGADPTLGLDGGHGEEVAGRRQLVEGLAGHSKHETQLNFF